MTENIATTAADLDADRPIARIPDGPMLDRLIGDAMGPPEGSWPALIGPRGRRVLAVAAVLGAAAAAAALRTRR